MLPLQLSPGGQFLFNITFKSTSANLATAQLTLPFTETTPSSGGSSTGPTITQNAIVLILQGSSPSFQLSYELQTNLNIQPLQSGGTINFGGTPVNTTALADLYITDLGSGAGTIQSITPPAGPAFKLSGTPLLPYNLSPAGNTGSTLTLLISYTPTAATTDNDQVQITLASGTILTVLLQGNGVTPAYAYTLLTSPQAPATPPGPIALPDIAVGSTSSVTVQVQNIGNANGVISSPPSTSGPFTLSSGTLFPVTLKPNDIFTFTINFTPTQPGAAKGTLVVGSDLFNLTGNGLGSQLAFSYTSSAGTIKLNSGDSVVFTPVAVTQSEPVTFAINNTGTQSAIISNIGMGQANSPFSVSGVQTLPFSLGAGASTTFTVNFAPTTVGPASGTLLINTTQVGLAGSGTQPPPLPAYTISGPSGTAAPQTQPGIGLTLATPYPIALTGTLTLTTSGNLAPDPTVLFINGLRTVPFLIPANSTTADFAGQGSQILLQTGTVAETITLTPDFITQNGGIDLTPSPATTLQFSVPAEAPVLLAVTVTNVVTNGFVLNVTGFSTTRSVSSITVQFNPAAGFNFGSGSQSTIDLTSSSAAWFQSSAALSLGGLFEISVPFSLSGTGLPAGTTLVQAIASVSATVTNAIGTSASLQAQPAIGERLQRQN